MIETTGSGRKLRVLLKGSLLQVCGLLLCVVAFLAGTDRVGALTLPAPPDGYAWVEFHEGHSAFLRPAGWFVKTQVDGEVATLFISKENMEVLGQYRTGLSVNVIRNVRQQAGMSASQFAERSVAKTSASKQVLAQWATPATDGVSTIGFRYRDPSPIPTMLIHTLLLADDGADMLRVLVFAAPESEWERAWVHGEKIIRDMIVG